MTILSETEIEHWVKIVNALDDRIQGKVVYG